jgi:2'-5' RNA ligase
MWEMITFSAPKTDKKDELHIAIGIPKPIGIEIHNWVEEQDWPKGTELEPLEEYHITMLFAQGNGVIKHKDDDWIEHKAHAVTLKDLKEFPPSEERDGLHPIVLLVESDTIHAHHNALAENALERDIDIGPYVRGKYVPHMTIGYGPELPKGLKPPKLTFETEKSSVSEPRDESSIASDSDTDKSQGQKTENRSSRIREGINDEQSSPSNSEKFINHIWSIAHHRAPYEAELLKLADSWQPRDQWPNALRERNGEPVDADCTCKDGEKLSCPVHGLHPSKPDYKDTLDFPDPSSPVGYEYHTDAPRTWMRAETSYTGDDDDRRDYPQSNSRGPDCGQVQDGSGFSSTSAQTQRDSWGTQRQWLFDDGAGDTGNVSQVSHSAYQSSCVDSGARNSASEDGSGSQEQHQDRQQDRQSQAEDKQRERRTSGTRWASRKAFEFGSRKDADRISIGQIADADCQNVASRSFNGFTSGQRRLSKKCRLWVDDTRHPPDDSWDWARDARAAKKLTKDNDYDHMSLDHDLGIVKYEGKVVVNPDALSGGDFAIWLHEHRKHMPKSVNIHSHNSKGTKLMKEILEKHTDVTTDRAADDLEEDWAREFKVHEPSEIEKEIVHLPEKAAGMTQPQRARALEHAGPDSSQVVHEFPDGWKIHKLITPADRQREGQLMHNCWAKPLRWEPDAPGEGSNEPYKTLDEFQLDQMGGPYPYHQWMSLRDPMGYPHASFFLSGPPGDQAVNNALGHGNATVTAPNQRRLRQYAEQNRYTPYPTVFENLSDIAHEGKVASHQLAWLPGSNLPGKGLVTPSGDVYTWPVDKDGVPHHAQYVDTHAPYQPGEGQAHFFKITPRGRLDTESYGVPPQVIHHILQTLPGLRAGERTDWHFAFDESDTREYDDSRMMSPMTQAPDATNPHPEKEGCTCPEGEKLTCPVHGLNPDPTQQGYDHSWSIPEGSPVGYPESGPRNYYIKSEGSVSDDGREQHDAQTHGSTNEPRAAESAYDGRESDQEKSIGIDHVYSIACDCPACEHTREHAWHVQGQGTSEEGWSGLPRAEGAVDGQQSIEVHHVEPGGVPGTHEMDEEEWIANGGKGSAAQAKPFIYVPQHGRIYVGNPGWYHDELEDRIFGISGRKTPPPFVRGRINPDGRVHVYDGSRAPEEDILGALGGQEWNPNSWDFQAAVDEDEHGDNLEGEDVAIPKPPIEIRKKRKEQEDLELVQEQPVLHSSAWQIQPASLRSKLVT